MTELPITLTCADYARVMPLATGEVKPEGIALTMVLSSRGSWPRIWTLLSSPNVGSIGRATRCISGSSLNSGIGRANSPGYRCELQKQLFPALR